MDSRDRIIADLRELVAKQATQLEQQAKRISELELQLAKALKNSSNSSKSPSSDIVKPPKKQVDRRKKTKRGGQKGHPRKLREPLPPDRVDEEILYEIKDVQVRELQLTPTDQFEAGVEPTNNHSEQQIRHCVIDRRITQGTRSAVGQRYHERMWTAIATCGKQGRSFFEFLHESIAARLNDQAAPSLMRD